MAAYMAYSLCLVVPEGQTSVTDPTLIASLRDRFMSRHAHLYDAQFTNTGLAHIPNKRFLNVVVSGSPTAVLAARSELLRQSPVESKLTITSIDPECIHNNNNKKLLIQGLNEIANETNCKIVIHNTSETDIHIYGAFDATEIARVRSLVLMDQMMGLSTDALDIPYYLHNLIAGRKHNYLQSIMEETATNIYLQSAFTKIGSTQHMATPVGERSGTIHLTGELNGIARAKEMINKLMIRKNKSMYHKQSTMHPRKLDWILLHQQEELRKILGDNGSFVAFPALGSGSNTLTVYAENRINAERTLRSLNHLAYKIYEVSFNVKSKGDGTPNSDDFIQLSSSPEALAQLVGKISQASGAELSYRNDTGRFEAFGTEQTVQNAYRILSSIPVLKVHHSLSIFAVELAADQREFLSGKKNGKVNKIMKTCGVRIKFLAFNEYNFVITIESDDTEKALEGLAMLQDELPAETSFFVPEIYHRRIIGVAGKNIQRVMKRFGVYVKFSGAEEFTSLGGYFENEHNVVARTPTKNRANLDHLKAAVMEFVTFQKDRDFITNTIRIPSYLHRTISTHHGSEIRETGRLHNTRVWWPERMGTDNVTVVGPASHIATTLQLVHAMILRETHWAIPSTETSRDVFITKAALIKQLADRIKIETEVQVLIPHVANPMDHHHRQQQQHEEEIMSTKNNNVHWMYHHHNMHILRLRYQQSHEQNLAPAKEMLLNFFKEQGVPVETTTTTSALSKLEDLSPSLISPSSGDSCLNIDQEALASIPSPTPLTGDDMKKQQQQQRDYSMFDAPPPPPPTQPPTSFPAFDGSAWGVFPEGKRSHVVEPPSSLKDDPLRAIFENMPSSPLHAITRENRNNNNGTIHPLDRSISENPVRRQSSAAVISSSMTGKNIWASPRLQASISYSPRSHQGPKYTTLGAHIRDIGADTRSYMAPPRPYTSFSATTLSGQNHRSSGYHQSMPDILFGRELFSNPYLTNLPTPPHSTGDTMFKGPPVSTSSWSHQLPTPPHSSTLSYAHTATTATTTPSATTTTHPLHYGRIEKTTNTVLSSTSSSSIDTKKSAIPNPSESFPFPCTETLNSSQRHQLGNRSPGFNI
ncbi:hypothetical protein BDA99DRAFT_493747 [Phascolomyces articulosus]|uniref:K Homology domain-containing protein n=1 Tax=Phascolomyces articulosus TaxID=60185 RepID=A0AAD5KCY4_9FUNG|nr:hypothetical protein BDA99DRAFT_493747 [Phascolomyces articulosus]